MDILRQRCADLEGHRRIFVLNPDYFLAATGPEQAAQRVAVGLSHGHLLHVQSHGRPNRHPHGLAHRHSNHPLDRAQQRPWPRRGQIFGRQHGERELRRTVHFLPNEEGLSPRRLYLCYIGGRWA